MRRNRIFIHFPWPLILLDHFMRVVAANPAAENYFSISERHLLSRPLSEIFHTDNPQFNRLLKSFSSIEMPGRSAETEKQRDKMGMGAAHADLRAYEVTLYMHERALGRYTIELIHFLASSAASPKTVPATNLSANSDDMRLITDIMTEHHEGNNEAVKKNKADDRILKDAAKMLILRPEFVQDGRGHGRDDLRSLKKEHGAAVLAHEIKNPLAAIRGGAQLLAPKLDSESQSLIHLIEREVSRINNLVENVTNLSQRMTGEAAAHNIHSIIDEALQNFSLRNSDPIQIIRAFDPSLPLIWVDRSALLLVINNLLNNAREALSSKGSEAPSQIQVRTRYIGDGGKEVTPSGYILRLVVELSIIDNGPGVDPDMEPQIFAPFVSNRYGGKGLGLAIAQKIIKEMSGQIHYRRHKSEEQSYFHIRLPIKQ